MPLLRKRSVASTSVRSAIVMPSSSASGGVFGLLVIRARSHVAAPRIDPGHEATDGPALSTVSANAAGLFRSQRIVIGITL